MLFRVISGYFVSSSKNRIKRVISGYSRESCYFAYFGPFRVISGHFGLFTITSPKGEFECLEATSTKCELLVVRVTFRI